MNLLEHYIEKVYSVKDITKEYEKSTGCKPDEPFLKIDLKYDCYGNKERKTVYYYASQWEKIRKKGYFMA